MKTNKKLFYAIIVIIVIIVAVIIYNRRSEKKRQEAIDEAESESMALTSKQQKIFERIPITNWKGIQICTL